jgi:hypothetical protein
MSFATELDGDGFLRMDKMFVMKSFNLRYRPAQLKRRALVLETVWTNRGRSVSQPRDM